MEKDPLKIIGKARDEILALQCEVGLLEEEVCELGWACSDRIDERNSANYRITQLLAENSVLRAMIQGKGENPSTGEEVKPERIPEPPTEEK